MLTPCNLNLCITLTLQLHSICTLHGRVGGTNVECSWWVQTIIASEWKARLEKKNLSGDQMYVYRKF